jgi:hypothetical protein
MSHMWLRTRHDATLGIKERIPWEFKSNLDMEREMNLNVGNALKVRKDSIY